MQDNVIKNILLIFLIVLVFYLLTILSSILIPFVLAFLFASIFQPLIILLRRWKIPIWIIVPFITAFTLMVIFGLSNIIYSTVVDIISNKDFLITRINLKLDEIFQWLREMFGIRLNTRIINKELKNIFDAETISSIVQNFASVLGSFTGSFIMFALYYIFLLIGMGKYKDYFNYVAGKEESNLLKYYERIQKSIFSYMLWKTLINLIAAVYVYLVCQFFDIPFSLFWGFLTWLLLYIPTIGSILAVLMPALMAFVQFDSIAEVLVFLAIVIVFLFLFGNLVEPKVLGSQLRLNTLVVIFGLVFWGYIWGIPGMLLSIPMMVILKIIFEHIPSFQVFARMMGPVEQISNELDAQKTG